MSDSPSTKQRPQLPFSGIIVIVGVLGLLFYEPPLRSLRPDVPDPTASTAGSFAEELVEARLWQDPLGPVHDYHAQSAKDGSAPAAIRSVEDMGVSLAARLGAPQGESPGVKVLAVMVQGGPYAEQVERRRRDRVSVISGLSAEGYESEDSDHLGYFKTRWDPDGPELADSGGQQLLIPYEWLGSIGAYNSSKLQPDVLLMWLDESSFKDRPLVRLESLLSALVPEDQRMNVEFALLGPATSEGLVAMLKEVCDAPTRPCDGGGPGSGQPPRTAQTSASGAASLPGGEPTGPLEMDLFLSEDILWEAETYLDDGLPELSAEDRDALARALAPAVAAAHGRSFVDSVAGIAAVLSEHLPNIDDSDPRWAESVTASWLVQTGNWSIVNDQQAIENLLFVVDKYLDDGLPNLDPSARADLDESLVGAFREALRFPHHQMLSTLGLRLGGLLPTVVDSDPEWARVSVEQWYGDFMPASFRATQYLLSRAGFYAASVEDPDLDAEAQVRWGLLQDLEVEGDADRMAGIIARTLFDEDENDADNRRVVESLAATWLAESGAWPITSDRVAVEALLVTVDEYLDDGLPERDAFARADLNDRLVGAFRGALRLPHHQMLSTLGSRLDDLLPTVVDSDSEWARVSVEEWYGSSMPATFRATQNLLSRAGVYADSVGDPDGLDAEAQVRWGLLQDLEAESDLDQIADIIASTLSDGDDIDADDRRVAESLAATWLAESGAWSIFSDRVAVETLLVDVDEYLDDGLPERDASARADLNDRLVDGFREALRAPKRQIPSALALRLSSLFPAVTDSNPEWALVSARNWYRSFMLADLRATQNLLSRAGFYADDLESSGDLEAESQVRWNLVRELDTVRYLDPPATIDAVVDILSDQLPEIAADSPQALEGLATTWMVESRSWPIDSDQLRIEALLLEADEYLDDGLPNLDMEARESVVAGLVDVFRGLPENAESGDLAALELALEESFPPIEDSDSRWAEMVTSLWYDRLLRVSPANDVTDAREASPRDAKSPEDLRTSSSILAQLHVYSSRATWVPFYQLGRDKSRALDALKAHLASFNRTVVGDQVLVEVLMSELGRRAFDPCRHTLVLVGESDTAYSRTLADSFGSTLKEAPPVDLERWFPGATICSEAQRGLGVMRMTYLRGLDGALPGEPPTKSSASSIPSTLSATTSPEAARAAAEQQERASGRGQIDYFRRLAAALEQQELDDRPIGAIGVVGSDIYDKLVVLQALRPRFPGTLFFTTDLDARLLHPTVYPYARNLLVASQYGLEVSSHFQGFFPPFRDGYQTSTFVAARWAVATGSRRGTLSAAIGSAEPRLFEIGRDRAYDITPGRPAGQADHPGLHPPLDRSLPSWWAFGKLAALLVLATTLVMPSWRPLRWFFTEHSKIEPRDKYDAYRVIGLAVLMALLLWAVLSVDMRSGAGEPFAALGGISAWPTELLRALATTIAVAFMLIGMAAIRSSNGELEEQCAFQTQRNDNPESFPVAEIPGDGKKWIPSRWWSWRKAASISGWSQTHRPAFSVDDQGSIAARIWDEYRMLGRVNNRTLRFVPMAGLYALLAIVIVRLANVSRAPVRGTPAQFLDWGLFFFSFATFTLLVFFVVDATRLCRRFIAILSSRKTNWPAELCDRLGLQRDLEADDVADYIDIRFIGERTGVIAPLVVYPFVVLFLLLISRNGYFDNWSWETPVVIAYGILSAFAIFSALVMRRAAEDARKRALVNMRRRISRALGEKRKDKNDYVRRLEMLVDEIRSIDEGAFAPWSRHPVVRAVLIPFGGVGIVALIDILSTLGL